MENRRRRGRRLARLLTPKAPSTQQAPPNPLEEYFDRHTVGPGLWKWRHYFEIYHRHFRKFIGREVKVVEIGVYSGGSLGMWKEYFGPGCRIYGVDIEPACRVYEDDQIQIEIGDQGDPAFWSEFVARVPEVDVVIDDGSHKPEHQIVTLEGLLPHMRAGGVYLCEDVLGPGNPFHDYVDGFSRGLHELGQGEFYDRRPTSFQETVGSVHVYPWVTVIELREEALGELHAPRHGTEWQPFFEDDPKVR